MNDSETLITYRYVRLAMVTLAVAIGVALLEQRLDASRFQGSISSYYYTPARGVFVASLFSIGVCLICVRGGTVLEDALLNVAGILSFVVALVPTPPDPTTPASQLKILTDERNAAIRNNFPALLWVGLFALAVLLVIYVVGRGNAQQDKPRTRTAAGQAAWASALITVALLAGGYVWYRAWHPGFLAKAHITAAIVMFALIAIVALSDGIRTALEATTRTRGWLYIGVGAAMALGGLGIGVADQLHHWNQALLDAEALLIVLFFVFWSAQTIDLWHYPDRTQAIAARRGE